MAAIALHQAIGTLYSYGCFHQEQGTASPRLVSYGFRVDNRLLRSENYQSRKRKLFFSHASTSQTPVFDPVSSPSKNAPAESRKKSTSHAV